jgi:hypothetical protein
MRLQIPWWRRQATVNRIGQCYEEETWPGHDSELLAAAGRLYGLEPIARPWWPELAAAHASADLATGFAHRRDVGFLPGVFGLGPHGINSNHAHDPDAAPKTGGPQNSLERGNAPLAEGDLGPRPSGLLSDAALSKRLIQAKGPAVKRPRISVVTAGQDMKQLTTAIGQMNKNFDLFFKNQAAERNRTGQ